MAKTVTTKPAKAPQTTPTEVPNVQAQDPQETNQAPVTQDAPATEAPLGPLEAIVNGVRVTLILMVRDPEIFDAPHEATVHPDEVENYKPGGWVVKE